MSTELQTSQKKTFMAKLVDLISSIFLPVLSVIMAAGVLKAFLLLLNALQLLSEGSDTYYVLSFISNAGFYFLPLLLAHSTAKHFGGDAYLALFLTAILFHPDFTSLVEAGEAKSFLTLEIPLRSYGSAVVPAILIGFCVAYFERFLRKWIPEVISFFAVPFLTALVMGPAILLLLGPAGSMLGDLLSGGLSFVHEVIGWPAVALLAGCCPLLIAGGFPLCFIPLSLSMLASTGYDPFTRPAFLAANISIAASALAVFVKSRQKATKTLALQASLTGFMGVTEPSIYGVLIPLKRPFLSASIAAAIGGGFAGFTQVKSVAYASPSLVTLPIFINDTFVYALITAGLSAVLSFVLTWILGFEVTPLRGLNKNN